MYVDEILKNYNELGTKIIETIYTDGYLSIGGKASTTRSSGSRTKGSAGIAELRGDGAPSSAAPSAPSPAPTLYSLRCRVQAPCSTV